MFADGAVGVGEDDALFREILFERAVDDFAFELQP